MVLIKYVRIERGFPGRVLTDEMAQSNHNGDVDDGMKGTVRGFRENNGGKGAP